MALKLYLYTIVGNISCAAILICLLSGAALCFSIMNYLGKVTSSSKAALKYSFTVFLVSLIISVFVPSDRKIKLIVIGDYLSQSEHISKLPENAAKYLNKFFEESK